jgi:hypothetical protein
MPRPTAAAEPEEEPPGECVGVEGVGRRSGIDMPSSVVTVLPRMTAPAWRSAWTRRCRAWGSAPRIGGAAHLGRHVLGLEQVLDADGHAVDRGERRAAGRPSSARSRHRRASRAPAVVETTQACTTGSRAAIDGLQAALQIGARRSHMPHYLRDPDGSNVLINLPFHYAIDDAMFYSFAWMGTPNAAQRISDPERVMDMWWEAFLQQHATGGGYLNICMHPFVSGRALRILMMDKLITRMKEKGGVWFDTCAATARHCIAAQPPSGGWN